MYADDDNVMKMVVDSVVERMDRDHYEDGEL